MAGIYTKIFVGLFAALFVFLVFGSTYKNMATNEEFGYGVTVSDDFNKVYTDINDTSLIGRLTNVGYEANDELSSAKAKPFDDFFDSTLQVKDTIELFKQSVDFIKNLLIYVSDWLGIPPIVFGLAVGLLTIIIAIGVAKAFLKTDL